MSMNSPIFYPVLENNGYRPLPNDKSHWIKFVKNHAFLIRLKDEIMFYNWYYAEEQVLKLCQTAGLVYESEVLGTTPHSATVLFQNRLAEIEKVADTTLGKAPFATVPLFNGLQASTITNTKGTGHEK